MKKMTCFVMALALALGLPQCKKEQPLEPQGAQVRITLNTDKDDSNGSRVDVTGGDVTFAQGDQIIVACEGQYKGTLTHDGTCFSGSITDPVEGSYLYFYFLGNKAPKNEGGDDITAGATDCSIVISDQTTELPVISMAPSTEPYSSSVSSYSARLHNKCSLMKFNVTTNPAAYGAPICITGMNNKVKVWFNRTDDSDAFEYSKDGEGLIMMKGVTAENNETWAIVLQQDALEEGEVGSAYTNGYLGRRPKIQQILNTHYYDNNPTITITTEDTSKTLDLSTVTTDRVIPDGWTLTGTLAENHKITIADGAAVTLKSVNINGSHNWTSGDYAGITCEGDATIILKDGSTNTVRGFNSSYPGIHVLEGKTLTIRGEAEGTGSLDASSNGYAAGIGGGFITVHCGNIVIEGGVITAKGGIAAAGIGSGNEGKCGTITISGGIVNATGGQLAPGIGGGRGGSCGDITISGDTITASKGVNSQDDETPNSIGAGHGTWAKCGTVTIGGIVYWDGTAYQNGGNTYLTQATTVYPILSFSISTTQKVFFAPGNLQAIKNNHGWSWAFAANQWDYVGSAAANTSIDGDGHVSSYGTIDLFGWVGASGTLTGDPAKYGISNSPYVASYGNTKGEALMSDWSVKANDLGLGGHNNWFTMTYDQWAYLLYDRTVNGGTGRDKSFTYGHSVNGVLGLVLYPDVYSGAVYAGSDWPSFEAKGCVFLPAAGYREGKEVNYAGEYGHYWTSSSSTSYGEYAPRYAKMLNFADNWANLQTDESRSYGRSVRLVRNVY